MMFSARSASNLSAVALRTVRRSLNTPVLAISQLPVGPASAAIAAHVDARDGLVRYTLAVRSERSRKVVFFSASDDEFAEAPPSVASEAALSLAEGMGFLFEEEDLPVISADSAALIWEAFTDSADPGEEVAIVRSQPLLTKFRRSPTWGADNPLPEIGSEPVFRGGGCGIEAESAGSDT